MSDSTQWADLAPRIVSAVLMIVVGVSAVYLGGWPYRGLVWGLCGLMMWELARMHGARSPLSVGLIATAALVMAHLLPAFVPSGLVVLPLLLAGVLAGAAQVPRDRAIHSLYGLLIMGGCFAMLLLRDLAGMGWVIWLILVVVVSDVAGYFAGRTLGGPKFWPRVSPKKTWSGTVAGWVAAGAIGIGFSAFGGVGAILIPVSMLTALSGQMGDIAESAVKRRAGVKDSSELIPGHGGVLDRFDAMMAAALFAALLSAAGLLPGGP